MVLTWEANVVAAAAAAADAVDLAADAAETNWKHKDRGDLISMLRDAAVPNLMVLPWDKSNIKCWNTVSWLDQCTRRGLRQWNCQDREAV